jgi:hypothetical protein
MNLIYCLTLLLIFGSQSLIAVDFTKPHTGWKKDRVVDGYTIFSRDEKNSDIVGIKVEGVMNAAIEPLMGNLRAVEGSENWTPSLVVKKTIKDISDLEAITYTLNDMPWPLWHREFILHNKLMLDKERKLLYVMSKSVHQDYPNYSRAKKSVMANVGYSNFGFRPIGPNKTYVELTVFVDPRGQVPTWIINFYQKKWPLKYLKSIEKRANVHKPALLKGMKVILDELRSIL